MPRFFCQAKQHNRFIIDGEDAQHITKSLRMQVGDTVTVCCDAIDYGCTIVSLGKVVELDSFSESLNVTEPTIHITLYQAIPKADKFDFIIQKAVELGVSTIVPMLTKHCVSRLDSDSFLKKLPRYNRIALEAAKQSGRGIIPAVRNIITYDSAISEVADNGECCGLLYYEGGGHNTDSIISRNNTDVSIFIGSEGGFSADEVELATSVGIKLGSLGRLILRCETAPIVAMTLVLNATGNM